ncbi:V-type ATPase subunit, partial [Clostridium haemolyticum]|uniref:V-type ATPase subunit n=1 Tax=Clostridium haemolyticum TaxID=84025 RepID=UPI0017810CB2
NFKIFEKLCDNFIMNFIKDAKYISFGPEPLIAYILAKENEIKIIRIIMVGKINNIDSQVIGERLREIYV